MDSLLALLEAHPTATLTILTSLLTGGFTLSGVAVSQWITNRHQAGARQREDDEKLETLVAELIAATLQLQAALTVLEPRWNAWRPRLMTVGAAFLEFVAGHSAGGLPQGALHASRVVLDFHHRSYESAAAVIDVAGARFTTVVAKVALLPDANVTAAALRLADAAADAMQAAGETSLYRRRATDRQAAVAQRLQEAFAELVQVTRARRRPLPPRRRWWWRRRATVPPASPAAAGPGTAGEAPPALPPSQRTSGP